MKIPTTLLPIAAALLLPGMAQAKPPLLIHMGKPEKTLLGDHVRFSFPVTIKNVSDAPVSYVHDLGPDFRPHVRIRHGYWRNITCRTPRCGVGVTNLVIQPGESVVTSASYVLDEKLAGREFRFDLPISIIGSRKRLRDIQSPSFVLR